MVGAGNEGAKGDPFHIGSALLLNLSEGKFLLTAAHIIDWSKTTSLYLGATNFAPLQFKALVSAAPNGQRSGDHADFAIAPLDTELSSVLSDDSFVMEKDISSSIATSEGQVYTCLSYPNSRNKISKHKGTNVKPALGIYTSLGRSAAALSGANEANHILVDYDAKFSRDEAGARVNSIALPGFSGGAIINLGRISTETLDSAIDAKLAAILIEGHATEKVILGTRLKVILAAVRAHIQIVDGAAR